MDDSTDSVKACDEAIKLYKELSELWGKVGMHARKWVSNESEVLKEIPEEERAMEVTLKCGEFPSIKTLGILWKASDDIFTFKDASDLCCKEVEHTKRSFLKKIPTLFDPFGFLSPYVVQGKVLLQEIWMTGLNWDDPLPLNISKKITNWLKGLETLSSFQVPRWLQCSENISEVTFHVFNDASEKAYESVIYQRSIYKSGTISINLVMSKSKVAPLQATSIPRLELLSAVLGLRLARKLVNAFQLSMDVVTFWCDSMNVLPWIRRRSRRFKPFVANRIGEIQSITSPMM